MLIDIRGKVASMLNIDKPKAHKQYVFEVLTFVKVKYYSIIFLFIYNITNFKAMWNFKYFEFLHKWYLNNQLQLWTQTCKAR